MNLIISEDPPLPRILICRILHKNAFFGYKFQKFPGRWGFPAPVGHLSANIFVGEKMYLKRDIERKQLFFSGTYIDHNINSIAKKYIRT